MLPWNQLTTRRGIMSGCDRNHIWTCPLLTGDQEDTSRAVLSLAGNMSSPGPGERARADYVQRLAGRRGMSSGGAVSAARSGP